MKPVSSAAVLVQNSTENKPKSKPQRSIWEGLVAVCLVYALPLLLPLVREGRLQPIKMRNETIYMVRVAAAARGDSLGNPYLSGHENAPKYMPELSERMLALTSQAFHISVVHLAALMRVMHP